MDSIFRQNVEELRGLLGRLEPLQAPLRQAAEALMDCWARDGKVLIAGNGGSAADAMHFAEELVVRFRKNRRALAAIALTDPTVITCAGNDFCYEQIFERQVQALGRPGDLFIAMTTSGNSPNLLLGLKAARAGGLKTLSFLGKEGGRARGLADIELIVPSDNTARIQEIHKLMFHALCEWIDQRVD
jgi:D-sedoheptulose 7-phosphate isomerase